jgi:hypothetical protein
MMSKIEEKSKRNPEEKLNLLHRIPAAIRHSSSHRRLLVLSLGPKATRRGIKQ